jgi:hypothetical protein
MLLIDKLLSVAYDEHQQILVNNISSYNLENDTVVFNPDPTPEVIQDVHLAIQNIIAKEKKDRIDMRLLEIYRVDLKVDDEVKEDAKLFEEKLNRFW